MTGRFDRTSSDRLLAGDPAAGEATPAVAALLRAATPSPGREPSEPLLAAMAAEARSSFDPSPTPTRNKTVIAKILTAKVAAVAAVVAFTATGAAAATGSLPDSAQDGIARAVSHVGVNLPSSADSDTGDATENLGPDATTDNHGTEVTDTVHQDYDSGADKGAAVSDTAKGDHGTAPTPDGAPEPDDAADVDTPNHGAAAGDVPSSTNAPVTTPNDGAAADDAPPVETPEHDAPTAETDHEQDGAATAANARADHTVGD